MVFVMARTVEEAFRDVLAMINAAAFDLPVSEADAWAKAVARDMVGIEERLQAELTGEYIKALTAEASPAAVEAARLGAEQQARQITGELTARQLETTYETISGAIASGMHPREAAKLLDEIQGLDSVRAKQLQNYKAQLLESGLSPQEQADALEKFRTQLLKERRETIAQTEMRKATEAARGIEAKALGAQFKIWITTGDDRVSDIDEANEAAGPIPFNEPFPSGDMEPPSHPNCRCTVGYIKDAGELDEERRLAEERAERTAQAKEGAAA